MPLVTTTEAGIPIQGPSATLIYDDWYPAMRANGLRKGKLATAMLLGIPLVLGRRGDGRLFAMRDSCPHRGIPLSVGWFDGNRVTCRYHGWEFEPCSGQCELIPSLSSHELPFYGRAFLCQSPSGANSQVDSLVCQVKIQDLYRFGRGHSSEVTDLN